MKFIAIFVTSFLANLSYAEAGPFSFGDALLQDEEGIYAIGDGETNEFLIRTNLAGVDPTLFTATLTNCNGQDPSPYTFLQTTTDVSDLRCTFENEGHLVNTDFCVDAVMSLDGQVVATKSYSYVATANADGQVTVTEDVTETSIGTTDGGLAEGGQSQNRGDSISVAITSSTPVSFGDPVEITASSVDATWYVRVASVAAAEGGGLEGPVGNTDFALGSDDVSFLIPIEYFLSTGSSLSLVVAVDYDITDPSGRRLGAPHTRKLETQVEEHTVELELAPLDGSGGFRIVSVVGMTLVSAAAVALV